MYTLIDVISCMYFRNVFCNKRIDQKDGKHQTCIFEFARKEMEFITKINFLKNNVFEKQASYEDHYDGDLITLQLKNVPYGNQHCQVIMSNNKNYQYEFGNLFSISFCLHIITLCCQYCSLILMP